MSMLFSINYSKRDNSKCRDCRQVIKKNTPYFSSQTSYENEEGEQELGTPFLRHFKCSDKGQLLGLFAKDGKEFYKNIKGFSDLSKEDQQDALESFDEVMSSVSKKSKSSGKGKKRKTSSKGQKKAKSAEDGSESEEGEDGAKKKASKKKKKKVKDENAPKKAQTAYFLFCFAKRAEQKKEDPEKKLSAAMLSDLWKSLTEEDKEVFQDQAKADRARYLRQKKQYEETGTFDEEKPNEEDVEDIGPSGEEAESSQPQQKKRKLHRKKKKLGEDSDEEGEDDEETEESGKEEEEAADASKVEEEMEQAQSSVDEEEVKPQKKRRKLSDESDEEDDE